MCPPELPDILDRRRRRHDYRPDPRERSPARPPDNVRERGSQAEGGTAHAIRLPVADWRAPEIGCCSPIGNRGAGATTAVAPILMSPTLRTKACTRGAGATTAVLGTVTRRFEETIPGSEAGATPEACSRPICRKSPGGPRAAGQRSKSILGSGPIAKERRQPQAASPEAQRSKPQYWVALAPSV